MSNKKTATTKAYENEYVLLETENIHKRENSEKEWKRNK